MRPLIPALLTFAAMAGSAQSWTTFYSAYEDGLEAQRKGDHATAALAFARAAALSPVPGSRVKTYGLNFLPTYHPYLRCAESCLALGDLKGAEAALKESASQGREPATEREALFARLRQAQARAQPKATVPPGTAPAAAAAPAPAVAAPPAVERPPAPIPLPTPAPAPAAPASPRPGPPPEPRRIPDPVPPPAPQPLPAQVEAARPAPPSAPPPQAPPSSATAGRTAWIGGLGGGAAVALLLLFLRGRRAKRQAQAQRKVSHSYGLKLEDLENATVLAPSAPAARADPNVHRAFGPWQTHRVLGRGGCATAYFGSHKETGEEVAIKVPHPHILLDSDFLARFRREAALGALLDHPRIVRIVDPGPAEGDPWLAMTFVRGTTLESFLGRHKNLPIPQIIHIGADISEAIAYAHSKGVVHRDLKPANIMLGERGAIVMDFGIARVLDTTMTATTMFIGTPAYSAPESIVNPRVGPPADRYALGIILFEMLAGSPPFQGDTTFQILEAQRSQPLPDLAALRPDLPPRLLRMVQRLCAKNPDERPEDGETLAIFASLKQEFPLPA